MPRHGGRIEPNATIYGLGQDVGHITVWPDKVEITAFDPDRPEEESIVMTIPPDSAPLFRMVANRLDEIAGRRERRA